MRSHRISVTIMLFLGYWGVSSSCLHNQGGERVQPVSWQNAYDLDGDRINDSIIVSFSGGGHCCYTLAVSLTSTGITHQLPFRLDGGYVGGLDLSQPQRFDIRKTDGPLPELVMEIETYNREPSPLVEEWSTRWGIKTHYIAVGFAGGEVSIRDWPRS